MLTEILTELYERDLGRLKDELEQYANDSHLWIVRAGVTNSGGNLAQHLIGNLKHFIGAALGDSGFVRDRDAEFSTAGVSRSDLISDVDATAEVVRSTLAKLTDGDLAKTYPIEVFGKPMTTGFFITHLATHFTYHLGQINYHRRLLSGEQP